MNVLMQETAIISPKLSKGFFDRFVIRYEKKTVDKNDDLSVVPKRGLEPLRAMCPVDFKSTASAIPPLRPAMLL
jgi:hypothetical protein